MAMAMKKPGKGSGSATGLGGIDLSQSVPAWLQRVTEEAAKREAEAARYTADGKASDDDDQPLRVRPGKSPGGLDIQAFFERLEIGRAHV